MKYIRYSEKNEEPKLGWVKDDMVGPVEGDLFSSFRRLETNRPLNKVKLHAPVQPEKIVCVGKNYIDHAKEMNSDVPKIPLIFFKPPSALIGHMDNIVLPKQSKEVHYEAELAVIIGKECYQVDPENVSSYIFGYTTANDVTARDFQRSDTLWTRAKGFDTFCPLGPWIETEVDVNDVMIHSRVNGELRQMVSSSEMVFSISQLIAFISSVMTLKPGDVVLTGTPSGVGELHAGDEVEIEVEGIGKLINPVVS